MTRHYPTGEQFTISNGTMRATVVEVGGGLRTFEVGDRAVLDGYPVDEMAGSGRGQVLMPWPNRIDGGRYSWNGQAQQLAINEIDRSTAIHGLVRFAAWSCTARSDERVEMEHTLWPSPGYPFTLELRVTYHVDGTGLVVTTTARNAGAMPAPFGAGQHPYLLPPKGVTVGDCDLAVPAGRYVETDDRGLPTTTHTVDGTAFDFRTARPIGSMVLDTAFTELTRDADDLARVTLSGKDSAVTMWMDQHYRYVQVFTADTLAEPKRRASVAVEPMTCPPNAFSNGVDLIRLEPDQTITTTWGLVVSDD